MNDKQKLILTTVVSLLVGAGIAALVNHPQSSKEYKISHSTMMHGEMNGMMQGLEGKTGDSFDQAFLNEMITHHQGAVKMAEAALQDAKHQEIKSLAQKIITAQNSEIKEMQDWQKEWYSN